VIEGYSIVIEGYMPGATDRWTRNNIETRAGRAERMPAGADR
jgi:hypothetical protein